jgi:hypothetical protein
LQAGGCSKGLYTVVVELLGHTTLEMTKRSATLSLDSFSKAVLSLEGHLQKKSAKVIPFQVMGT